MNMRFEDADKPRIVNYDIVNNTPLQVRDVGSYVDADGREHMIGATASSFRNYRKGRKFYAVRVHNDITLHAARKDADAFMRENANAKPECRTFRARSVRDVPEWAAMQRERVVTVSFDLIDTTAHKMFGSQSHNAKHVRKQKERV